MSFVLQLRLDEVAPYDLEHQLPRTGLLSFYYDSSQQAYGANPADRGACAVFFLSGDSSQWQPRAFPDQLPASARFQSVSITYRTEWSLPAAPDQVNPHLGWSKDDLLHYETWLVDRIPQSERSFPHHRLLGYPDQLQDDMQLEAALASQGFTNIDQPGAKAAAQAKASWTLLLQLDSDPATGMRWASSGLLDYWIRRSDLEEGHFNQVWAILQSD
jgi:uncharacterized protein YwqG